MREAGRHADNAFRLAVDPPGAKELRLFGLATWSVERFKARRRRLFDLRLETASLREHPVLWSLLMMLGANLLVLVAMATDAEAGKLELARLVTFAGAAVGTSVIAFGGCSRRRTALRLQPVLCCACKNL